MVWFLRILILIFKIWCVQNIETFLKVCCLGPFQALSFGQFEMFAHSWWRRVYCISYFEHHHFTSAKVGDYLNVYWAKVSPSPNSNWIISRSGLSWHYWYSVQMQAGSIIHKPFLRIDTLRFALAILERVHRCKSFATWIDKCHAAVVSFQLTSIMLL